MVIIAYKCICKQEFMWYNNKKIDHEGISIYINPKFKDCQISKLCINNYNPIE